MAAVAVVAVVAAVAAAAADVVFLSSVSIRHFPRRPLKLFLLFTSYVDMTRPQIDSHQR